MTGYLDHIFAGERVRRTEDRHEHLIQDLAVAVQGGVVDGIGFSGLQGTGERLDDGESLGSADTQDGYTSRAVGR